ncbi:hypothetical protein [Pseudactinotalea suaedae]|uniref:hypothetical protein n=1 Tax=Pseudactinotalea suaedae TaxID=1524924 RepID=UPI0012E2FCDC|nr:hypothetical protein [Pseudactinotalea suaedae]
MNQPILTEAMREVPAWAVLQRRLFDAIETAWRQFAERYTEADGRLRYSGGFEDRDGVDDLYEPFFNWPAFYLLGGSDAVLTAAKHHWSGVTAQLTEAGMLTEEYENGYDWFHQGESLVFFYGLCAADPSDPAFAGRAARFADLYTDPARGNYDPERNIIRAPHNGARGALEGLGPTWQAYSADLVHMEPYGLPLHGLPGITSWDDLRSPANAQAMGRALHHRAQGDTAVNLAATSLVANRWLYDGDPAASSWISRYVGGWHERADRNRGLIPDNVAPDGTVGGLHEGRWYGGHYGWTWPHGLHSVASATLVAGLNASLVTGDSTFLDVTRTALDTVLEHAITAPPAATPFSLSQFWRARYGAGVDEPALLVPHRHGTEGWFDFGPMQLEFPLWLWWWTRDEQDRARLDRVLSGMPAAARDVQPFRDKMESGHDAPWLAYLDGDHPEYPVQALSMALGQVARRVALMETEHPDPADVHLHYWQRVNPVVTEILSQLITGTPQTLYNGGLPFAALSYEDLDRGRAGLPQDVAALVTSLDEDRIEVEVVNLSPTRTRRLLIRASAFGEHRLERVDSRGEEGGDYPGPSTAETSRPGRAVTATTEVDGAARVTLPPSHRTRLTLYTRPSEQRPHHRPAGARALAAARSERGTP